MHTVKDGRAEPTFNSRSILRTEYFQGAGQWLSSRITTSGRTKHSGRVLIGLIFAIFVFALGVRALHFLDSYSELKEKGQWMPRHARHYKKEALRMLNEGGILFPRGPVDPGDARLILHPPGYSAFMAAIFASSSNSDNTVTLAQLLFDAISAVMIFLIAAEFFNYMVAAIAGLLAGLSPHFAHYSLWASPDTLCVLPILVAVYLTIKAIKQPHIISIVCAGAMVGVSCWLRANALMLAPFLAVVVWFLVDRGKRWGYSAAFVAATVLVVMPITVRNWILFHHFIPISIAGGENLIVGIADFDKEGRFGMPISDADVGPKEAVWYNRPDYAANAWLPDGVERDQARYARGLEVIRANPGWFIGIVLQRAFFMLRSNDFSRPDWPFNTSKVPIVAADPAVMHSSAIAEEQPVWSGTGATLLADKRAIVSRDTQVSADATSVTLRITGDDSHFGHQFASAPIAVKPRTDYLLKLRTRLEQGLSAAKVTSSDQRITLAVEILTGPSKANEKDATSSHDPSGDAKPAGDTARMVFSSGDRDEIRVVISNNGVASERPVVEIEQPELFSLGETPYQWTRYPRALVRGIQKNLFKTNTMLPLEIIGLLLLALAGKWRALVVLLAVPFYYLVAQSPLSTEYRYVLALHSFFFVFATVTLVSLCRATADAIRSAFARFATTRPGADMS